MNKKRNICKDCYYCNITHCLWDNTLIDPELEDCPEYILDPYQDYTEEDC